MLWAKVLQRWRGGLGQQRNGEYVATKAIPLEDQPLSSSLVPILRLAKGE